MSVVLFLQCDRCGGQTPATWEQSADEIWRTASRGGWIRRHGGKTPLDLCPDCRASAEDRVNGNWAIRKVAR